MSNWPVYDFAGGIVVHVTAGMSGLSACIFLGKRNNANSSERPHNIPMVALGTAMLWFGWFGTRSYLENTIFC